MLTEIALFDFLKSMHLRRQKDVNLHLWISVIMNILQINQNTYENVFYAFTSLHILTESPLNNAFFGIFNIEIGQKLMPF